MPQANIPLSYREGGRCLSLFVPVWIFSHLAVLHDKDPVRVHDCIEPVSDGENRAPGKLLAYRFLLSTKTGVTGSGGGGAVGRSKKQREGWGKGKKRQIVLPSLSVSAPTFVQSQTTRIKRGLNSA